MGDMENKHASMCVRVFQRVCAFLGRTSLRPSWRDNIINLYASDFFPLREENSQQSRDTGSTLRVLVHTHAHIHYMYAN